MNPGISRAWPLKPLVDARSAAYCLALPKHWLNSPAERRNRRIPHYRIGSLIRFDLCELTTWMLSVDESPRPTKIDESNRGLPSEKLRDSCGEVIRLERVDGALAVPRRCYRGAGSDKSSY